MKYYKKDLESKLDAWRSFSLLPLIILSLFSFIMLPLFFEYQQVLVSCNKITDNNLEHECIGLVYEVFYSCIGMWCATIGMFIFRKITVWQMENKVRLYG